MNEFRLRVVKIGGSLLNYQPLARALTRWLDEQNPAHNILLAGGGDFTDVIRRADSLHGLGEEAAHWLCVQTLDVTARLMARLLPEAELITTFSELRRRLDSSDSLSRSLIFSLYDFLDQVEPYEPPEPVPHTWSVTTDSLAARLAEALDADELVLLKSADPPCAGWRPLAICGYVDEHFPHLAERLRCVRCVNLRAWFESRSS